LEKPSTTAYDGATFQYSLGTNGNNWITIGVIGDPVNWYTDPIFAFNNTGGWGGSSPNVATQWTIATHALPGTLAGQTAVRFRFYFTTDASGVDEGFGIDDFTIFIPAATIPLCAINLAPFDGAPLNYTYTSMSWARNPADDPILPAGYKVYYDTTNPPTRFFDVGFATTFSQILAPLSTYYWKVVPYGYGGAENQNCPVMTFTTPFEPSFIIPYSQDFESGPDYWTALGTLVSWARGTPAKNVIVGARSGVTAWVTGGLGATRYNNNEKSFLLSPSFDFSNITSNAYFSAYVWWNSESTYDGTILQFSVNEGITWTTIGTNGDQTNWYNTANVRALGEAGWSGSAPIGY